MLSGPDPDHFQEHPVFVRPHSLGQEPLPSLPSVQNSPEAQEEHEGHQKGRQGDAVAQVVDDDGRMVVHFALLLQKEGSVVPSPSP